MKYTVVIEPFFYFEIAQAMAFVNNVSNDSAKKLLNEIMESIRSLEEFPNRYPKDEEFEVASMEVHRMNIWKGRYSVLYRIDDKMVYVESFYDNRRVRR